MNRSPRRRVAPAAVLVAVLGWVVVAAAAGCGYRPLLRDAKAPGGVTRIDVPLLENRTEQVGIEAELTAALVDHLDRYRAVHVTDREADAVLTGTIRSVALRPTAASGGGSARTQAFWAVIVVDLQLRRAGGGEVLWQATGLRGEAVYDIGPVLVGEDILAAEDLRRRSMIAAGTRVAEEGVELLMGGR
jgi:Lipopolysaccharide-assembly